MGTTQRNTTQRFPALTGNGEWRGHRTEAKTVEVMSEENPSRETLPWTGYCCWVDRPNSVHTWGQTVNCTALSLSSKMRLCPTLAGKVQLQARTNLKLHFFFPSPGKQTQMHKSSIKDERNVLVKVNTSSSVHTCLTGKLRHWDFLIAHQNTWGTQTKLKVKTDLYVSDVFTASLLLSSNGH